MSELVPSGPSPEEIAVVAAAYEVLMAAAVPAEVTVDDTPVWRFAPRRGSRPSRWS